MPLRLSEHEARRLLGGRVPVAGDRKRGAPKSARSSSRPPPQETLWSLLSSRFPGAQANHRPITGRRFSIDISWPDLRVAVEVDGWSYHGRFKRDFHRDREKRNLLALQGWTVLAIPARDVWRDPEGVARMVDSALAARRRHDAAEDQARQKREP